MDQQRNPNQAQNPAGTEGLEREVLIRLEGLTKAYDGRTVVDVDQLIVRRGEIMAIVGPSGAGKSTLLRLINFLEPPSGGTIRFSGGVYRNGNVPIAIRRRITTVFQRPALLKARVLRNVAYGLRLRGRPADGSPEELLQRLGLADLARADARGLSAGEAQRVALARALVLDPKLLLLDEPTANLDPYNIRLIETVLRERNQEQDTAMLLVTHDIFQARRLADRVALMLDGRIIESATTESFFDSPQDPRTAAFLRGELVVDSAEST